MGELTNLYSRSYRRRYNSGGDSTGNGNHLALKALVSALERRDAETHGHSERVVRFSLRLGRELGLCGTQLRSLALGALLHDIGKMAVPDAILRKPAKLTDEEWIRMRQHPLLGQRMLRGMKFLEDASVVVAQHHEKWDGSGYPFGLRREEINLNARIFAVVDAFDAIVSDRVYSTGVSFEWAVMEIERCAGGHFDPKVVEAFGNITRREWQDMYRGIASVHEIGRVPGSISPHYEFQS